ncbi:single-stranded DNA-binding protein [Tunicatimonas pelagia]|uniref:single-stranded DNA-binding protein n=1 Tax=Tunicatimonas pelagia TaxID=931531 RepID=UPI00266505F9|nr:single-stranded DNA-binding protein [Tunicatimonas pelagia]WKN44547.1 single-stranded DNA-binding protein [Tunicatimonas pelagia]
MAGVNKVILVGNLGADPEVRHLESGSKVANISIATSESYTNRNGERVEQTEWHRVELWDRLADLCEKYLAKGRTVYIEGKIRTNEYQDKEGITRYDKRIRATNMTFVGGRNEEGGNSNYQPSSTNTSSPNASEPSPAPPSTAPVANTTSTSSAGTAANSEMDDLPF